MTSTRNNDTSSTQYYDKNPGNVAGGLKAAIHNPNVSEEAKERAAERLHEMGANEQSTYTSHTASGGYSEGQYITRDDINYAREILEAAGYSVEKPAGSTDEEHETRVLAGYKAALNNPRVSSEAKRHAEQYLKQHGAI